MDEKRFALLIDADNISQKYLKYILNEMSKYGVVTYKRIYGDWTRNDNSSWKPLLLENSITPIQQYSYTIGKNATDSAMIIDAMDILYTGHVNGFCLASSDSDFTKLASRLRESGMTVIGMGEDKTPKAFRVACDRFTCLEILLDPDLTDKSDHTSRNSAAKGKGIKTNKNEKPAEHNELNGSIHSESSDISESIIDRRTIETVIVGIITENVNDGRTTGLGEIGSTLVKMYPEFDVRNYGYSLLSKLLEEFPSLRTKKTGSTVTVELRENGDNRKKIEETAVSIVKNKGDAGMLLGDLSNKLHLQYKEFNVRDYGYSSFSKYVQSIQDIEVLEDKTKEKMVRYVARTESV